MREELGLVRTIRDINLAEFEDHFLGAVLSSAAIGSLGWQETNSAAGTNSQGTGAVNHPGVLRMLTGAVSGNNKRLHLGQTASEATFTPGNFDRFRWVVRIPTITTVTVRLGLMQDVSAALGGTAGAFFSFDPSVSANWQFTTRQASTSTIQTGASAVVANNWYLLEAARISTGWQASVNTVALTLNSANLPTTDCAYGVLCQTGTAAGRNIDLDYTYARGVLGQLWT